ncbi:MAG: DUF2785 domain-containing protein, partial [Chloroflexi bacterium]|nr:DUF2785 domain-containing protein [Chloroflexota bacterium]
MDAAFWQAIVDADYAVPEGYSARELMPELVSYLGSTDPQLRDHFAYGIMVRWIVRQDYTPDDLRPLVEQMIPNLARGVGEQGTDSVFLRSFSALMLAASVYYDNHRQPYLTPDEFRRVFDAVLAYLRDEQDVRGFVAGQGWAHSVAHTADLVDELALSRHADAHDLEQILDAIAAKVMTTASPL